MPYQYSEDSFGYPQMGYALHQVSSWHTGNQYSNYLSVSGTQITPNTVMYSPPPQSEHYLPFSGACALQQGAWSDQNMHQNHAWRHCQRQNMHQRNGLHCSTAPAGRISISSFNGTNGCMRQQGNNNFLQKKASSLEHGALYQVNSVTASCAWGCDGRCCQSYDDGSRWQQHGCHAYVWVSKQL